MDRSITARRVATLVGEFDRNPAYAGLADALVLLIGDGRIPEGTRLPSERELTEALGVSRTTVTRAYAAVRDAGFADARQGSGTFTQVPGGAARAHDRALLPRQSDRAAIDLNCAAPCAPPQIAGAYAEAAARLPAYLGSHGYFPAGMPELQAAIAALYDARGLPTDPAQIMVTPGALSGVSIVAAALAARGDRVLVDTPGYPNAAERLRSAGARLATTEVDPDQWDLDAATARVRQVSPRLAYLIPDFHNPTGLLMSDAQRERYAAELRRGHVTAIVDESHQLLALEGQAMPRPFAAYASSTITVGSVSKSFWGGLRVGWVRAPLDQMERLTNARVTLDLGVPVMEQLATARLLEDPDATLTDHRARLREQRDALVVAVRAALPDWTFRVPEGGLSLWCQLPGPGPGPGRGLGTALADEAERHGVIVAPGPVFAPDGGLDRFVRIPFTRRIDELHQAVAGLADAWRAVSARQAGASRPRGRVMVA
ncbi:MAG TPA: PLP-dependent aminotransferase family protein [Nocardioides bacterium]|uniref:MocR-like transcription factor YczR n=1 Tax=uncultured Nocardioides sp. TaxID=198441 RepID=UPI000ED5543B|nr:PLP-dependent aminotransferase family protein [uncultured Nocardioides sp.]HCB03946.1 PLP-dependent aminotransferase family protein [Nocardioides sp.]